MSKQNYVTGEKEVKVEEVKNDKGEVVQKAETKIKKVTSKIDNTIVQNKAGNYVNTANDYQVEFDANPNKGWSFKNSTDTITVSSVAIGGKNLNKGKVLISTKPDRITFEEVLPNIDLEYTVNSDGVQKSIVIKNEKAWENDLSKIEFTLKSEKGGKIEKKSEKTNIRNTLKKSVANKVATTDKELITSDLEDATSEIDAIIEKKATLNEEDQKVVETQKAKLAEL